MISLRNSMQAAVTSLDEGAGHLLIRGLSIVLLGAALFGLYAATQFRGLHNAHAMELAQLARNLSSGNGFTTQYVRPVDLWRLDQTGRPRPSDAAGYPELRAAPLWPSLLAVGFKTVHPSFETPASTALFEPETRVIVPLGIALSIATGLLLLLLGNLLFDDRTGLVALLLLFLNPAFLRASVSGSCIPAATFLVTAAITVAVLAVRRWTADGSWLPKVGYAALGGLLCAGAFLTAYSLLIVLPLMLLWIRTVFTERRWLPTAIVLLVFLGVIAPWLARNVTAAGGPFGMAPYSALEDSLLYPEETFARSPQPSLHNVRIANAMKAKVKANALHLFQDGFGLPIAGIMAAFFLVSLLDRFDHPDTERLKWHIVLGILLAGGLLCVRGFGGPDIRRVFLPLILLYGTGFFFATADRVGGYGAAIGRLFAVGVVSISAIPYLLTLIGPRASIPYPPYYPPLNAYAAHTVAPDAILCTDVPEATAWYGNRTSLLLPNTVRDFLTLTSSGLPCAAVYLTSKPEPPVRNEDGSWAAVRKGNVPEQFPFQAGAHLPPDSEDQLLLTGTLP